MGIDKSGETKANELTMMEEALSNFFPVEIESDMRSLATDYDDIFRTKIFLR